MLWVKRVERVGAPSWATLCGARAREEKGRVEWVGAGRSPSGLERTGRRGRKRKEQGEARLGRQWASAGRKRKGAGPEPGVGLKMEER